jgi:hypothetical protein
MDKDADGKYTKACDDELVLGIQLYFRLLKSLVILFLLFSLINLPAFILFYYGGDQGEIKDSKTFFSVLTLGNLGQSQLECAQVPLNKEHMILSCPFGSAQSLDLLAVADMGD